MSTTRAPEICEYPDSDKCLAIMGSPPDAAFKGIFRMDSVVDYWDGEVEEE